MNLFFKSTLCLLLCAGSAMAAEKEPPKEVVEGEPSQERAFKSIEGKTIKGKIIKYIPIDKMVVFESSKRIPLGLFSEEDQAYILHWRMVRGFLSTFTFKIEAHEKLWARRNWKRSNMPYWLESLKFEGKETPFHVETMLRDFEESVTVKYTATGYTIRIRNGNSFPLENITVQHKIFYEQEEFLTGEDIMLTSSNTYNEVVVKEKRKGGTELVEVLEPYKDRFMASKCALLVDYTMDRNMNDNVEEGETENPFEGNPNYERIPGFNEWIEGSRRERSGKIIGIWLKMGMKDVDGNMVYREFCLPKDLPKQVSWDIPPEPAAEPAGETIADPETATVKTPPPGT